MGFVLSIPGWFNIWQSIDIIQHINKLKKKNHIIISIDIDKTLHNPTHIHNKNSQETWNNRNFLNLIKNVYEKPATNNILNDDGPFP